MRKLILFAILSMSTLTLVSCDDSSGGCKNDPTYQSHEIAIRWYINGRTADNSSSFDTCGDVDALRVRMILTGPEEEEYIWEDQILCNEMMKIFRDESCDQFPDGNYTLEATLVDANDVPVSDTLILSENLIHGTDTFFDLDFTMDHLLGDYIGTIYLDPTWDGDVCANADPEISSVEMTFFDDGEYIDTLNWSGNCVNELDLHDYPAKLYEMRIAGYTDNQITYCGIFELKVGIGYNIPVDINVTYDATECANFSLTE
ncbi:MAG: hypothetical protein JXR95_08595 [Deltaproteobacteria bacterium]|nr:hypothetical protein [Deltaproteobacteria bacterium]